MVDIKIIKIDEIEELLSLWYKYHEEVNPKVDKKTLTKYLFKVLDEKNSLVIGLYKQTKLVGFTIGYEVSDGLFYWEGIYVEPSYRLYVYKLIHFSENVLRLNYY